MAPPLVHRGVNFFKKLDFFGQPVQLTIDGKDSINSLSGAIISLFFVLIISDYAFREFIKVYTFEDSTISAT